MEDKKRAIKEGRKRLKCYEDDQRRLFKSYKDFQWVLFGEGPPGRVGRCWRLKNLSFDPDAQKELRLKRREKIDFYYKFLDERPSPFSLDSTGKVQLKDSAELSKERKEIIKNLRIYPRENVHKQ